METEYRLGHYIVQVCAEYCSKAAW